MPTVSSACRKRRPKGVASGRASGVKILPNLHADGNQKSYRTGSVGAQDKNGRHWFCEPAGYQWKLWYCWSKEKKQKRRSCKVELKVGTLNVGTMTGREESWQT